jgi:hypothetical protein
MAEGSRSPCRGLARGAALADYRSVRLGLMAYVIWLGVIGCGRTPVAPVGPPVAASCTTMRIGQVLVTGAPRDAVPALAVLEGTIDDPLRGERILAVATERLRDAGYARAAIAIRREARCFTDLHVAVTLGPRFAIARIDFQTQAGDDFPDRARRAALEDALGTVNTVGGVYIDYRMKRALVALQERYRDAGWLEATVSPPVVHYGEDGKVTVEVAIRAGPRFRVSAIRARGAGAKARAAVLDEIAIEPGGWYDGMAIRNGIARARRRLDRWVEVRTTVSADRGVIELEAVLESNP